MSRINMKNGITVEQVNEAAEAYDALMSLNIDADVSGKSNRDMMVQVEKLRENADSVESMLGADHIAVRKIRDAADRLNLEADRIEKKAIRHDSRTASLIAKVNSYDGWFVMVEGEKIPVTRATVANGKVIHNGKQYPFVPVYFPSEKAGLRSLFDNE